MSDYENHYRSPETQIVPEAKQGTGVELTVKMLQYLNEASPWLRFVGILGYITAGFTIFGGIAGMLSFVAVGSMVDLPSGIAPAFGALFFIIYLPTGVLTLFLANFIFKFGQKIRYYKLTNSIEELEEALKNNKSLWKFIGILCIVSLALIPVMLILTLIVGVVGVLGAF